MNFDYDKIQSVEIEKDFKISCYKKMAKVHKEYPNLVRTTGLFVGVASFIVTVIARIALIVEIIFKGICNIFAFPDPKKTSFSRGLELLTMELLIHGGFWSSISIISSAINIFNKTFDLMFHPDTKPYFPNNTNNEGNDRRNYQNNFIKSLPFFEREAWRAEWYKRPWGL